MRQLRSRARESLEERANTVGDFPEGYREPERIGEGAEGGAWRARAADGAAVVVKRVPEHCRDEVTHAFGVLRSVGSPHLPAPRALATAADGGLWMVTDWVAGDPLTAGPVGVAVALGEGAAVARALAALHAVGTHHGDVSAGNVVVAETESRRVTLVDLAQLGRRGVGTPGFMAPEVLAGGGGPAADRFALGSLLAFRLFGDTPWRRPETLLAVRGRADVEARLDELGATSLDPATRALLTRLLDPQPAARPVSTDEVARHLETAANGDALPVLQWWPPRRWPYVGAAVQPAISAVQDGARLVVVAGPRGSGRTRVSRELIQQFQALGLPARSVDASEWAEADATPSWIGAWLAATADDPIAGVAGWEGSESQARRLGAAARLAKATAVVRADAATADVLEGQANVVVLRVRPLDTDEVATLLGHAIDGAGTAQIAALATAMVEVSGGWPAGVVRLAESCSALGAVTPNPAVVEHARAGRSAMPLHEAWSVLREAWRTSGGTDETHAADVQSSARASVGPVDLRAHARGALAQCRAAAQAPTLALALDAADASTVLECLRGTAGRPRDISRAVVWVETRTLAEENAPGGLPAALVAFAMERRLAEGNAPAAAALGGAAPRDPHCRFAHARALQRLGHREEALALLAADDADPPRIRWSKQGLRWRVWVDQGDAELAADDAANSGVDTAAPNLLEEAGDGIAVALLWAAYASLTQGDTELCTARLSRAEAAVARAESAAAHGVRARVLQLRGNLAHAQGALPAAAEAFAAAAQAFERAGEPIGGLTLRGSLCALAIPTLDLAAGIEHGRAAIRGLLAQGQNSALLEAATNVVQLLGRVGGLTEAEAVCASVRAALPEELSALDRARLLRLDAERLGASSMHRKDVEVEVLLGSWTRCAQALQVAGAAAESEDAWLRAAAQARQQGQRDQAQAALDAAQTAAKPAEGSAEINVESAVLRAYVTVGLCADADDAQGATQALTALRAAASWSALHREGRLEAALLFDRTVVLALYRGFDRTSLPTRRAVATRLLSTLERVMQKTKPIDRSAARTSLMAEGGDTQVLRELLDELEGAAPSAPRAPSPALAESSDRYARLLRMYRRFAREDRLEPLLEHVVDAVMELTDAERGAVVVQRDGGEQLTVTRELAEGSDGSAFSRSVIARVLASGEPVLSVDAAADDRFDDSRSISHLNLRSVLAVPLHFRGSRLGAVYVDHRLRRGNFGEDDLAHMEAFADLAALAVAHAAALEAVSRQTGQLEAQREQLAALLERREAEVVALREDARRQAPVRDGYRGIIGSSAGMQRVFRLIDRLADATVPVVVYGESGTGKELVARAIHDAGARGEGPFVAENCGAIPETLLESVLFGHAKGAFTGAQKARAGLFEAADGGTIFLDEVSEMSAPMQTKLLRVLQEGEVRRVGETAPRKVDVRVVAAANRDLEALVASGEFRGDLFYRINVVKVDLPPLRERVEDIRPLIDHFVARHGAGRTVEITPAALRRLSGFGWPGNVRQLENEVQRWIALCEGAVSTEDLSAAIAGSSSATPVDPDDLRIRPRIDRMERELIKRALEQTGGNQTQAALLLGLSRYGLQKKLKRLHPPAQSEPASG